MRVRAVRVKIRDIRVRIGDMKVRISDVRAMVRDRALRAYYCGGLRRRLLGVGFGILRL